MNKHPQPIAALWDRFKKGTGLDNPDIPIALKLEIELAFFGGISLFLQKLIHEFGGPNHSQAGSEVLQTWNAELTDRLQTLADQMTTELSDDD